MAKNKNTKVQAADYPNLAPATEFHNENGNYRPGGDAQHVSALIREIALDALIHTSPDNMIIEHGVKLNIDSGMVEAALQLLPTTALQDKLRWAVRNVEMGKSRVLRRVASENGFKFQRATTASSKKTGTAEGFKTGSVKIGRWNYPTRTHTDGSVERNTKTDGSGEWIFEADGK